MDEVAFAQRHQHQQVVSQQSGKESEDTAAQQQANLLGAGPARIAANRQRHLQRRAVPDAQIVCSAAPRRVHGKGKNRRVELPLGKGANISQPAMFAQLTAGRIDNEEVQLPEPRIGDAEPAPYWRGHLRFCRPCLVFGAIHSKAHPERAALRAVVYKAAGKALETRSIVSREADRRVFQFGDRTFRSVLWIVPDFQLPGKFEMIRQRAPVDRRHGLRADRSDWQQQDSQRHQQQPGPPVNEREQRHRP